MKNHLRRLAIERALERFALRGVGAEQPVLAQEPEVAQTGDARFSDVDFGNLVGFIDRIACVRNAQEQVDF